MNICDKGAENLASGIILQAANDYRDAFMSKKTDPNRSTNYVMEECERFFHSDWYKKLTDIDGDYLIKNIKIQELEKVIAVYTEALSIIRNCTYKIYIAKVPRKKATDYSPAVEEKPAIEYSIPPRLVGAFKEVVAQQLEELKQELNELTEDKKNVGI